MYHAGARETWGALLRLPFRRRLRMAWALAWGRGRVTAQEQPQGQPK